MESTSKKRSFYTIFEANAMYLLIAIGLMTVGSFLQRKDFYSGMIITEYGLLLLPVILLGLARKVDLKQALKLKKIRPLHGFLVSIMALALLPTVAAVNYFVIWLLSFSDRVVLPEIPTPESGGQFIVLFFIISISAGLCEEFFFRGMILNAFSHGINRKWGIVLSGVLFGFFHFDMQRLLGTMILGIVFAYLVEITGSIWAGVIAHMTNNGVAVVLSFGAMELMKILPEEQMQEQMAAQEQMLSNPDMLLTSAITTAIFAVICLIPAILIIRKIRNDVNPYEPGSEFTVKGVDYLVLEHYNESVLAIQTKHAVPGEIDPTHKREVSLEKLRALDARRRSPMFGGEEIKKPVLWHYSPWLGVAGLYGYYVFRHLTYVGS